MAQKDPKLARIRWACRRGMLELDVILEPFFDHRFGELDPKQQQTFEHLLACDDPELFSWFMGHAECRSPELANMVETIVEYNQSLVRSV